MDPRLRFTTGSPEAADRVLREGLDAKLPPHLSTLLGLSQESEFPVKQRVLRTGKIVEGFDVSMEDKKDIVLFVVDEGAEQPNSVPDLSSGRFRKMVSVTSGVSSVAKITDEDKKAFEKEKEFWLGRLAPPKTSK